MNRLLVNSARCLLILIASALVILAQDAANKTYSTVELPGKATEVPDGFQVRIDSGTSTQTDAKGRRYAAFTFDFYVPRAVGNTVLGSVFLEVVDRNGRTLAEVALEPRNPENRPPNYYLFVEQRFAARCLLHFEYKGRPMGNIVKDYVLRLKNHLTQNQ
ncbi:MAG TPA: hypothetical protein VF878_04595 [Candidatus Udaeobacter sp.]